MSRGSCICIPARDEAERLPRLFAAIAEQSVPGRIRVALCVNNSVDNSAEIARRLAAGYAGRLELVLEEVVFEPPLAHAGSARRAAMDLGASVLTDRDVLVSTDADCRPPATWLAAILDHIDDDVIVGGRLHLDDAEQLPPAIVGLRDRFDRYWEAVRAIEDEVDPCPWDPAPRHGDHTGASLALTVGLYHRAGGIPLLANREDVALVDAARRAGGRLVHPASVWTRTSARAEGRAMGGMAAEMARLAQAAASGDSPLVPSFRQWRERAAWRSEARMTLAGDIFGTERLLPPLPHDMPLPKAIRA